MTKRLLSLLLVLAMLVSLVPMAMAEEEKSDGTRYFEDQYHDQDIDMETVEPTPITQEEADALVAAIETLLADETATDEALKDAFLALAKADMTAFTNYQMLHFRSDLDVTDEELADAATEYYNLKTSIGDQMRIELGKILATSHKDYMIEALNLSEDDVEYYTEYEAMTDEEKAISAEMQDIENEYTVALNQGIPVEYNSTEYTEDSLEEAYEDGTVTDDDYYAISDLLDDSYMEGLGEIYLKMVDACRRLAKLHDADNYTDYAYEEEFERDYTTEEIQAYCDAVKKYIAPLAAKIDELFYNDYYYYQDLYWQEYATEDTLDTIQTYLGKMSPEMLEAFTYMRDHNLYDITYSEDKNQGAYTYELSSYGAPYIFLCPDDSIADFSSLIHEFGHYNNSYWHPMDWNDAFANDDVAEVHSQGLEMLFSQYYDEIFGEEGAELAEISLMDNVIVYAIIYGAVYGELELYAHTTPDVTYEDLCNKMEELSEEYMLINAMDWETVHHLTTQPLYYISYSVSAIGATAFWLDAQENGYDTALDKYLKFVALDPTMGFQEQFEAVGMENPLSAEFIQELATELEEVLDVDARLTPVFFTDVPLDSPYYDDVTYLAVRRGTSGFPDGTFRPEAETCLGEAYQMLYNLFYYDEEYDIPFTDTEGKWYEDAAGYCYYYDVFAGDADPDTEDLELGGDNALDLQTLCLLVCQMLESYSIDTTPWETYEYTDTVADWAKDAVDYCYESGYIDMAEDGSIGAADPVTRVEMARMLGYLFDAVYSY